MSYQESKDQIKTRVLIVDDEEEIRETLSYYLSRLDCAVVEAMNGEDGLIKFKSGKFDLVITDQDMPYMQGTDLIKAIRKLSDVKVVMITGGAVTEEVALNAGADKFLSKPFDLNELELFIALAEISPPQAC